MTTRYKSFYHRSLAAGLGAVSLLALASAASAQEKPAAAPPAAEPATPDAAAVDPATKEVVVTGSRVARAGYNAPTPVTVISETELKTAPLIGDALMKLPELNHTTGPTQQTNGLGGGRTFLNLRNLGPARTLVLVDGRRFVSTSNGGTVDVSLLPSTLLSHVDVVTGGASAAYGSDAVAGVVNFVLDTKFEGIRAGGEVGVSTYGDDINRLVNLTMGTSFSDGRGHIEVSGEYSKSDGLTQQDRAWLQSRNVVGVVANPGAGPTNIHIVDPRHLDSYTGGIVTSGPLKGLIFGQGGTPGAFAYGTLQGSVWNSGGNGDKGNLGTGVTLGAPLKRLVLFGRTSFDVTPNVNLFLEGNFAHARAVYGDGYSNGTGSALSPTIQIDNGFLDPTVKARMVAAGITSFRLPDTFGDLPFSIDSETTTKRLVTGLAGDFSGWKVNAYYTWGETKQNLYLRGIVNQLTLYPAIDSVLNGSGQVVCRSTLTNPGNGCVPFNPMGVGVNSAAAIKYVTGDEYTGTDVTQNAAALSASGNPITLPAGPVSIAAGIEWRRETFAQTSDAISQMLNPYTGIVGGWRSGNTQPVSGANNVKEAFGETVIPIFKEKPLAESLEFSGAIRVTDYSYSGTVTTWKLGGTYEPVKGVRFRLTRSRDIRAPNLGELYANVNNANAAINDPFRGVTTSGVKVIALGNLALKPEVANTLSFGVVLQPSFAPRFQMSLDRWDINIRGSIATLTPQQVVDQCFAGAASLCANLHRNAANVLISVDQVPFNLSQRHMTGFDFETTYAWSLGAGTVTLRALGTYLQRDIQVTPGIAPIDRAGDIGQSGEPKWAGTLTAYYKLGGFSSELSGRYIGSGNYDNTLVTGTTIDYNHISPAAYMDGRVGYAFDLGKTKVQAYFAVNNILNRSPVITGQLSNGSTPVYTDLSLYDPIGRFFRIGLSVKY